MALNTTGTFKNVTSAVNRVVGSAKNLPKNTYATPTSTTTTQKLGWSNGVFYSAPSASASTVNTPETTTTPTQEDPNRAKALAYLKDYVNQMRAAGFPDYNIAQKLMETKIIQVPSNLPENFGQTIWATGMADERRMAAMKRGNTQEALKNWVPSPNEYLEYMPGYTPNRLPTYRELTGQETSPFSSTKSYQTKLSNLRNALKNYMANYQGSTISPSQYAYEAGIVGLPQDIGQQYYQEFLDLANQKAEEQRKQDEYDKLVLQYPEIEIQYGDTPQQIAEKIRQYNEIKEQQEEEQPELTDVVSQLNNAVYQATVNGETVNMEDVVNMALMMGIKLTYDEATAIFNSAKQQALRDMQSK